MTVSLDLISDYLIAGAGVAVDNPANGEIIATVKEYSGEETAAMIDAAHDAMSDWVRKTAKQRAAILRRWHDLMHENKDALAAIATAECGKPVRESLGEVVYAASFLEWFAEEGKRVYGDIIPTHAADKRVLVLKQPVGVTAAITPWNFPIAMITRKAGPALAAGCPMLVKPPAETPLSALALEALARQAGIPKDIFRVITTNNAREIGEVLCSSPTVRKLSFTGSTATGKILARQCADTVKKLSLELGGNAPFIVFDDADIDAAVEGAIASKYRNAGQTCVCANRILVQDGIHDAFVSKFSERVSGFRIGDGAANETDIGPLITQKAADGVARLVDDAVSNGAKAIVGGAKSNLGETFYEPTILTNVDPSMLVVNEEIFGPVAPIIRFNDAEEAIRIANDTPYGLAAYFYAKDMALIWRVMEALEYGMVGVNEGIISSEAAPFGGVKESGIGREGSRYGIDEYVEMKYALLGGLQE